MPVPKGSNIRQIQIESQAQMQSFPRAIANGCKRQLPFYVSVCLPGIWLSAFFIRTLWLTPLRIFKDLTTKMWQNANRRYLSIQKFLLHILWSYFSSPWKLFDAAWFVPQLSNQAQIQTSQFLKNLNWPKFWMLSVIRKSFSRQWGGRKSNDFWTSQSHSFQRSMILGVMLIS